MRLAFVSSDARILDQMRKGDEEALVTLYEHNRRPITAYVLKNSGDADEAEDVLQECLVILWERVRAGRFTYRAQLSTFLFSIAKNLWHRSLARKRRELPAASAEEPFDDALSTLDLMIEEEDHTGVSNALQKIGETCRELLMFYYWEELTMEEIARRMNFANAATAKSKKYQCKKALERILTGGAAQ
jgi:RNA polymerase sigma factor (sigma-70 family)